MPLDLSSIPIIDQHCHSLLREQPHTAEEFRAFFTESYYPEIAREHVQHTIFYQWSLRALAEFFECQPRAETILEKRNALPLNALIRKIVEDANIRAWLVDYGYSTTQTFAHHELAPQVPCRVERILRLEPLIEQLVIASANFGALYEAYVNALQDLRGQSYVSLKSIIAYRVGLQLSEPDLREVKAEFEKMKERATREGKLRIDSKPLLDFLIIEAMKQAHEQEFPIQFHTGFGDPDQDLAKVNPAFLRPIIHSEKYRGAKIVLLHASYPYARTLGYLASVYPNVYADFGLAIPFAAGDTRAILRELLALAPASKVMYSSDAFHIPELYWLGAKLGRRTLGAVLDEYVAEGLIDEATAYAMAEMILWRNAEQVYL
jgi:predicted TIM-barrel fold metal-dependent hydrolase